MDKTLKARLKALDKIREDLKKAEKTAYKEIMEMLKTMIRDNDLIAAVKWQQYTPSFNDGEPCEFSLSGPYIKFTDKISGISDEIPKKAKDDEEDDDDYSDDSEEFMDLEYDVDEEFFEKKKDILNYKEIDQLKKAVKDVNQVFGHIFNMEDTLESMFGSGVEVIVTADGVETEDYDCGY